MLIRWKFEFLYILLWIYCLCYMADSIQTPNPNYVAPSMGRPGSIMPFSLYRQKLEKEKQLKALKDPYEDGSTPVKVYLPAFKNANESHISQVDVFEVTANKKKNNELDPKIQAELLLRERMRSRFRGPIRPQLPHTKPNSEPENLLISDRKPLLKNNNDKNAESMTVQNRFVEQPAITDQRNRPAIMSPFENSSPIVTAKTYSTGASREQISASELHKSVLKQQTNPATPDSRPSFQKILSGAHKSTLLSLPPDRPHTHHVIPNPNTSQKEGFSFSEYFKHGAVPHLPRLTNGVPLEPISQPIIPTNYQSQGASLPFSPQYTPLQPVSSSSNNILETLLGSTGLRQAPPNYGNLGVPTYQAGGYGPGIAPPASGTSGMDLNPLQQLLGGGSPLEHMAKLAKNLLTTPEGNQIINRIGNLLDTKNGSPLLSNAIIKPASEVAVKEASEKAAEVAIGEASKAAVGEIAKPVASVSSGAAEAIASASKDEDTIEKKMTKLMEVLPSEQRNLLEAALKSGEITPEQVSPTLSTMIEQDSKSNLSSLIHSEGKLMEWIQQNRPRTAVKETMDNKSPLSPEKLPYYGKYCGSFVENRDSSKKFGVSGAVWAVDDKHLMVSKFFFQPGSSMENITFWAGPRKIKGDPTVDIFPSENGFYLKPEPVNIRAFIPDKIEVIKAKVRGLSEEIQKIVRSVNIKNNSSELAEIEENDDDVTLKIGKNEIRRMKRDAFREVYEHQSISFPVKIKGVEEKPDLKLHIKSSAQDPLVENMFKLDQLNQTSTTSIETSTPLSSTSSTPLSSTSTNHLTTSSTAQMTTSLATTSSPIILPSSSPKPTTLSLSIDEKDSKPTLKSPYPAPLEWSAGFQPLLLTFPEDRWVKNTHWLSLYDHKRKETVAFVLMPNGAAFQIPYIVQLRPLARNPPYMAFSGPIQIADTKTIIVHEFTLQTDGLPVWFLIGKEIIPNSGGHIVPVYNKETGTFDCDSLRDYKNETVVLKLPGTLDIKDVYYFAVFSIPKATSLTSIHVPYLDLQVPPNLEGISAPKCIFEH